MDRYVECANVGAVVLDQHIGESQRIDGAVDYGCARARRRTARDRRPGRKAGLRNRERCGGGKFAPLRDDDASRRRRRTQCRGACAVRTSYWGNWEIEVYRWF